MSAPSPDFDPSTLPSHFTQEERDRVLAATAATAEAWAQLPSGQTNSSQASNAFNEPSRPRQDVAPSNHASPQLRRIMDIGHHAASFVGPDAARIARVAPSVGESLRNRGML